MLCNPYKSMILSHGRAPATTAPRFWLALCSFSKPHEFPQCASIRRQNKGPMVRLDRRHDMVSVSMMASPSQHGDPSHLVYVTNL